MRKLTLVCCIAVLVCATAGASFAQIPSGPKFGAKGGLAMAKLGGDANWDNIDARNGFAVGPWLTLSMIPGLNLQAEALYVQKGAQADTDGQTFTTALEYIDVAVLLRKELPTPQITPYFMAGPVVSFLAKAESDTLSTGGTVDAMDIKDNVKGIDFGLMFGAGLELKKFLVEVRYTMGLADIDDDQSLPPEPMETKNSVISVLVGVAF